MYKCSSELCTMGWIYISRVVCEDVFLQFFFAFDSCIYDDITGLILELSDLIMGNRKENQRMNVRFACVRCKVSF